MNFFFDANPIHILKLTIFLPSRQHSIKCTYPGNWMGRLQKLREIGFDDFVKCNCFKKIKSDLMYL